MGLNSAGAIEELSNVTSVAELRELIGRIDARSPGNVTVFYSGESPDNVPYWETAASLAGDGSDVRIVHDTEISKFLDLEANPELVEKLQELFEGNPSVRGTSAFKFLNGDIGPDGTRIPNGIWDEVSTRFASEAVGEVRVLASMDRPDGVFALSELPALLDNPKVTDIEGIPRTELANLARKSGYPAVANAVALNSQVQMTLSGLAMGDVSGHLDFHVDDFGQALKDPVKREAVTALLNDADPQARAVVRSAVAALLEGAEVSRLNGVSKTLNRMGYVGGLLSFLLVSSEASAASSEQEAEGILKAWAVEAVGGETGAIIGTAVAGIAVAAVGVASAPVSAALILGASMVGGFLGAAWASDFYGGLSEKEEIERGRVLGRLAELYFGEGAAGGSAGWTPPADSSFAWIDPGLSADDIYQAAKTDLAWRYALMKLNPFVVTGVDYASIHGANGELDLYDDSTAEGLTDQYLRARAESLHIYTGLFEAGIDLPGGTFPKGYAQHFFDAELQGDALTDGTVVGLDEGSDIVQQRLFGSSQDDLIQGGGLADMLFGGQGDDHLDGREGADYLEGGNGDDAYLVGAGDVIFDSDGSGRVMFDGVVLTGGHRVGGSVVYASDDGRLRYERVAGDLQVSRIDDGARVTVRGHHNGGLGISLDEPLPSGSVSHLYTSGSAESEVIRGEIDVSVVDQELLNAWNLPDHIAGLGGRDWIYAWDDGPQTIGNGVVINSAPDTDIVEGGPDKDFIHGGAGADRLHATDTADSASVMAGQGSLDVAVSGSEAGDFISGQSGDDALYGSGRLDGLFGGDGDDLIYGGAGDDIIDGDRSAVVSPLSLDASSYDYQWYAIGPDGGRQINLFGYQAGTGDDRIHAGDGDDLVWGGAADDTIYGDAGNDQLNGDFSGTDSNGESVVPGQYHGDDFLSGGAGDDAINGNGGDDILLGGDGDDLLDGDFRVLVGNDDAHQGDDYLDGGAGRDTLSGNGGSDLLRGGDGNDILFGDLDGLDPLLHGSDVMYGGDGDDQLVGQGGDDRLYGGNHDDIIYGDDVDAFVVSGDDRLFGGPGSDELSGGLGDDSLHGGDDADRLWGDAGDDRLSGGRGLDYLVGGSGADTYVFSPGDSPRASGQIETVVDAGGQGNVFAFSSDVLADSVRLSFAGDSDDLVLSHSESDALHITGGLTGVVSEFVFGDADPVSYQDFLVAHIENACFLQGGNGNDLAFGSSGDDAMRGGDGDDRLLGGGGNDELDGGTGINRLVGGAGADTYLIAGNGQTTGHVFTQNTIVDSPDRSSVVRFGAGVEVTDLRFQELGSTVLISSSFNVLMIGDGTQGQVVDRFEFDSGAVYDFNGLKALLSAAPSMVEGSGLSDELHGTPGRDIISARAGDDLLFGGAGGDRLDGGEGADLMSGGSGYDSYVVDDAGDQVIESANGGFDWVFALVDYDLPEHVEALQLNGSDPLSGSGNAAANYIVGNSAANTLSGGAGNDQIVGDGGLDVLDGGDGDDLLKGLFRIVGGAGDDHMITGASSGDGNQPIYALSGGPGNDLYEVSQPYQIYKLGTISEQPGEGEDTLLLRGDGFYLASGLPDNVENLRYEYSGDLWFGIDSLMLRGNGLDNRIEIGVANPGAATELHGLGGNDTLIGSDEDESGTHTRGLFGGDGDDLLQGLGGADNLFGGAGDDILEGGPGSDRLVGGIGVDTYVFARGDSLISEDMSVIHDEDGGSVIRFGPAVGARDIRIDYVGLDMHLQYSEKDTLVIEGGAQDGQIARYEFAAGGVFSQQQLDRLLAGNAAPSLTESVPIFLVHEGRPQTLSLSEGLFSDPDGDTLGYTATLKGAGSLPEWIRFDALTRSFEIDAADGDAGNYTLSVSAIDPYGDSVAAAIGLQVSDTNLVLPGAADAAVKGSAGPDNVHGSDVSDRLYGYAAEDWLFAGDGDDRLYGGAGNDLLLGGAGTDVLNGQAGDDEMIGGHGDDRYYVDSAADTLFEQADGGLDRVLSDVSFSLGEHFEDLVLRGELDLFGIGNGTANRLFGNAGSNELYGMAGDDRLLGRDGNDRLFGGSGQDVLNGESGDDEMAGGDGDDRYYVDSASDVLVEAAGAGVDWVFSDVHHVLATNFEHLTLRGALAVSGTGNAADNRLSGNAGDNELRGAAGNDRLFGRDGSDRLFGESGDDVLIGGNGDDELVGGLGDDRLYGREGDDILAGGVGDDVLDGGRGSDQYRFGMDGGSDRIRNAVDSDRTGEIDSLIFTDGIDPDGIWFARVGNDLQAQLIGSDDQIRMSGWFTEPSARLDHIATTEGEKITADRVEQLVNAVATFNVESAAALDLSPNQQAEYSALVAAHWQPATAWPA